MEGRWAAGSHLFQTAARVVQEGGRPESGRREVQAVERYAEGEHLSSFTQGGANAVLWLCTLPATLSF